MPQETIELFIFVYAGPTADGEERDELTHQLVNELDELDRASVEAKQADSMPEGAKGIPAGAGTILVKMAEVGGITGLITILTSWLSRDERRTMILQIGENKLEVKGISKAEQAKLIQWFQTQTGLRISTQRR
jgi:hypothetical protein